ncbi:regulator of cell morphogenesis and NO signaling [Pedobacter sp. CG_S7]|uniref:iron-sulfur cluster repair di-iron protein n=1 Tax=Pedobacter sp. CG_S7 TaxID=3143930 RepID=UPI003394AC60
MDISEKTIIGELVAEDYRTAAVFQSNGIDFCCQGNRTIKNACDKKEVMPESLINELNAIVKEQVKNTTDFQSWPIDLLADYIEKKHHRYVTEKITAIKPYLEKICKVHGIHHPELFAIKEEFFASADELTSHMKKEEQVLFPYVRTLVNSKKENQPLINTHFGTIKNPIAMMMQEHDIEGERFRKIAGLSNNYTPPADACNTYKVSFAMLKEYEDDLHTHIHLENNILFPKAIELEKELNV